MNWRVVTRALLTVVALATALAMPLLFPPSPVPVIVFLVALVAFGVCVWLLLSEFHYVEKLELVTIEDTPPLLSLISPSTFALITAPTLITRTAIAPNEPAEEDFRRGSEVVIGYKVFKVKDQMLHGAFAPWPKKTFEAECGYSDTMAAEHLSKNACACGVYSYKSRDHALTKATVGDVLAEVIHWGWYIPAEHGYRAQFTEIQRMWVVTDGVWEHPWDLARYLEKRYGVPCETEVVTPKEEENLYSQMKAAVVANFAAQTPIFPVQHQTPNPSNGPSPWYHMSGYTEITPPPCSCLRVSSKRVRNGICRKCGGLQ